MANRISITEARARAFAMRSGEKPCGGHTRMESAARKDATRGGDLTGVPNPRFAGSEPLVSRAGPQGTRTGLSWSDTPGGGAQRHARAPMQGPRHRG